MKNKNRLLLLIFILLNLSAYSQISVTGTAYSEIVPLATAKETEQLNFGKFSPVSGNGSITISPVGIRVAKGSVILSDGNFCQGTFVISGSKNNSLSVSLPNNPQLLHHYNSNNTISMDKWTYNIPETSKGENTVNIGATLNFKSMEANPSGLYSGKYQVIFVYN